MVFYKWIILPLLFLTTVETVGQDTVVNNSQYGDLQTRNDKPLTFELVQTFGTDYPDESAVFSSPKGIINMDSDSLGNLYVLDNIADFMIKFSPSGEVIWKNEKRGKGPGDLENPSAIAVGNYIYIVNINNTRLDIFTLRGEYERTINLDFLGKNQYSIIGLIKEKFLVIKSKIFGKIGVKISVLDVDNNFELVSEFDAIESVTHEIPENEILIPEASIVDDHIVLAKSFEYGFKYYNLEGVLVKEINRDFPNFVRPGFAKSQLGRIQMIPLSSINSQHRIKDDYLINYITFPTKVKNPDAVVRRMSKMDFPDLGSISSLDLFSPNGKLLYSEERIGIAPEIGVLMHSDTEGNLYTKVGIPYPQIKKYRVILN